MLSNDIFQAIENNFPRDFSPQKFDETFHWGLI